MDTIAAEYYYHVQHGVIVKQDELERVYGEEIVRFALLRPEPFSLKLGFPLKKIQTVRTGSSEGSEIKPLPSDEEWKNVLAELEKPTPNHRSIRL